MAGGVPTELGAAHVPKSTRPEIEREHDVARSLGLSVQAFWRLPENEQAIWRRRFDREQGKCLHCGNQRDECSDPDKDWYPQLTVCYVTRARLAAQRTWDALHEKLPFHDGEFKQWQRDPAPGFFHYAEGSTVWVASTDLGQGGDFLRQRDADDDLEIPP